MTEQLLNVPETPRRPTREAVGGIEFEDPYAWLEEDSSETLAWQDGQTEAAVSYLHGDGFEALRDRVAELVVANRVVAPQRFGAHWFELRPSAAGLSLVVSDEPLGEGRVLVDSAAIEDPRGPASLDWFYPSPDGTLVAYGISFAGDEQSIGHVLEVETGRVLDDRIPFMSIAMVSWLPDSSGFYYNAGLRPDFEDADKFLFVHRIGQGEQSPPEPLRVREQYCVFPQVSADGRYVAAITSEMDVRADFVKELPDGEWRPFLNEIPEYCFGVFEGDRYIAISMADHPRGRLVSIPVATGNDRSTWTELVPESDAVLRTVTLAGDRLVLAKYRDTVTELSVLDLDGNVVADVELPGPGVVKVAGGGFLQVSTPTSGGGSVHAAPGELTFVYSSLVRSPAVYLYDIEARRLEELRAPDIELTDMVVERGTAKAPDGEVVHHWIVRPSSVDPSQPQPTLIYAYGGWNIAFLPGFMGPYAAFVEAGGTLVLPHLRGGGEFGSAFWHDGRLAHKQHTFDDLYATAEALLASGRTTIDRLAVAGGSNGGLLTGAAVTQRPELWRAVVSLVPLYDMLKFGRDSYTASCVLEYGDPEVSEQAEWLYAYSPYHNVGEARYPATLIYCGANDMRCWPWHSRKLAARLQGANQGDRPILLRVVPDGGHRTVGVVPEQVAEWLGFAVREVGLS
jgi:prolyl oligopeptidase